MSGESKKSIVLGHNRLPFCYQAVRMAYCVIKGSGVRSVNSCWMVWQANTRSPKGIRLGNRVTPAKARKS
jgi:hypothetical protein